MTTSSSNGWLTSKDILAKTGISRATLNNYIKKGILPPPVVQAPKSSRVKIKRIGYFPYWALRRIEDVARLKQEGQSIAQIAKGFQKERTSDDDEPSELTPDSIVIQERLPSGPSSANGFSPRLTIDGIATPAYLLDHHFRIIWINLYAEQEIFHQQLMSIKPNDCQSVFKILFDWRFHERIKNWRDLIALHTAFVKMKYAGTWLDNLHEEFSKSEMSLLKEIYEAVTPFSEEPIHKTYFQFLTGDTISRAYGIFTLLCVEGLFFLYIPLSPI